MADNISAMSEAAHDSEAGSTNRTLSNKRQEFIISLFDHNLHVNRMPRKVFDVGLSEAQMLVTLESEHPEQFEAQIKAAMTADGARSDDYDKCKFNVSDATKAYVKRGELEKELDQAVSRVHEEVATSLGIASADWKHFMSDPFELLGPEALNTIAKTDETVVQRAVKNAAIWTDNTVTPRIGKPKSYFSAYQNNHEDLVDYLKVKSESQHMGNGTARESSAEYGSDASDEADPWSEDDAAHSGDE